MEGGAGQKRKEPERTLATVEEHHLRDLEIKNERLAKMSERYQIQKEEKEEIERSERQLHENLERSEQENKRIKDVCKRQRQKVSEFERFLVKQSEDLNKHCLFLHYQIKSFGIATEAMNEPCLVCLDFPEVATTTEQARNGTERRWVVPCCGHAICSRCLGDILNPRVVTCSKCNKPLIDFEYSDLKIVKQLKPEMESTLCSFRKVQHEVNN